MKCSELQKRLEEKRIKPEVKNIPKFKIDPKFYYVEEISYCHDLADATASLNYSEVYDSKINKKFIRSNTGAYYEIPVKLDW